MYWGGAIPGRDAPRCQSARVPADRRRHAELQAEAARHAQTERASRLDGGLAALHQALAADQFDEAQRLLELAANRMGVEIGQVRLVAAHAWDLAGAQRAGCKAAFVARPGMVLDPFTPRPDVVGTDLADVAEQIIAVER
ncbi:MAG: hypothetical protein LC797_11175 [Chloroflexi bacterium]|nr:hypothetical protein [Chloroflexota bacterium]